MFIVNNGNWYGYSPHSEILKRIEEKYMLIEDVVGNHKGALVYAIRDTTIKSTITSDTVSVTHKYARGYTLHGTDVGFAIYTISNHILLSHFCSI
jgi:hypothetical protein